MAITSPTVHRGRSITDVQPAPKCKPAKWWAAIGVLSLGMIAYSWGTWLLGGHAKPTPSGDVPTWMVISARVHEVVFLAGGLCGIYWAIIKPWRRERRLRFDGMLCIALGSAWMLQDPLLNYGRVFLSFNSAFVNLGCPQCYIPGWQSYGQTMPEPILWALPWYLGFCLFSMVLFNRMMRWFQNRWPRYGKLGPLIFILCFGVVFDIVFEIGWMRLGLYTYFNVPKFGTLFYGHYYQIPILEGALAAVWFAVPATMRYYKDDNGLSWAERGIDEVKATPKQRTALRLLAVIGMLNAGFFLLYNIPMGLLATHFNDVPKDVYSRPYFANQMCGPGTKFACYDPRVPVPDGDSGYVTPEGKFIAPKGLPVQTAE